MVILLLIKVLREVGMDRLKGGGDKSRGGLADGRHMKAQGMREEEEKSECPRG